MTLKSKVKVLPNVNSKFGVIEKMFSAGFVSAKKFTNYVYVPCKINSICASAQETLID